MQLSPLRATEFGHLQSLSAGRLQAANNIAAILLAPTMRFAHAPRGTRQADP